MELWKPIAGFYGLYEVSNAGRVRSLTRVDANRRTRAGRVLVPVPSKHGYNYVSLAKAGVTKRVRVCRLVAQAFIGTPDGRAQVNHRNGLKSDDCVGNLEWVSPSANIRHSYANGLQKPKPGEKNHRAKVSDADAREIVLAGRGKRGAVAATARRLGVNHATVLRILNGERKVA